MNKSQRKGHEATQNHQRWHPFCSTFLLMEIGLRSLRTGSAHLHVLQEVLIWYKRLRRLVQICLRPGVSGTFIRETDSLWDVAKRSHIESRCFLTKEKQTGPDSLNMAWELILFCIFQKLRGRSVRTGTICITCRTHRCFSLRKMECSLMHGAAGELDYSQR